MGVLQFALVLLMVSCATLTVNGQDPDVQRRYNHFLTQHVYGSMNRNSCDRVIGDRHITAGNTNNCKETNTFIQATHEQVRAVCQNGGRAVGGNLYESTKPFRVVTCSLKSGDRRPNCKYKSNSSLRKITVGCDRGWPVHYEEDRLVIN